MERGCCFLKVALCLLERERLNISSLATDDSAAEQMSAECRADDWLQPATSGDLTALGKCAHFNGLIPDDLCFLKYSLSVAPVQRNYQSN